jgi:hypothetical protein
VKVRYVEGVAIHSGPESCAVIREGDSEALTGVRAGQPSSAISREAKQKWVLCTSCDGDGPSAARTCCYKLASRS